MLVLSHHLRVLPHAQHVSSQGRKEFWVAAACELGSRWSAHLPNCDAQSALEWGLCTLQGEVALVPPVLPVRKLGPWDSRHRQLLVMDSDPLNVGGIFQLFSLCLLLHINGIWASEGSSKHPAIQECSLSFCTRRGSVRSAATSRSPLRALLMLCSPCSRAARAAASTAQLEGWLCRQRVQQGIPDCGKIFSVFKWLGLCDLIRDGESYASVFLGNCRFFWKRRMGRLQKHSSNKSRQCYFFSPEWVVSWHVMLWLNIFQILYLLFIIEIFFSVDAYRVLCLTAQSDLLDYRFF